MECPEILELTDEKKNFDSGFLNFNHNSKNLHGITNKELKLKETSKLSITKRLNYFSIFWLEHITKLLSKIEASKKMHSREIQGKKF